MNLSNTKLIGILISILLGSIVVAHFLAPSGIMLSPIVISLMAALIFLSNNTLNVIQKSILAYFFIGLNDIGIRFFAGGIHDMEGNGWIVLMMFVGLVPAFIILITGVLREDKAVRGWLKVTSIFVFVFLIYAHLQLFGTLGIVRN